MKNSVKGVIFCMLAGSRATASVQQAYMLGTCVMEVCVLVLCLLFSLLRNSYSMPLVQRSLDQVSSSSEEGWPSDDAGAVNSCVLLHL